MLRCLPICRSSIEEVEQILLEYAETFDAFEIWLDTLADLSVEWLDQVRSRFQKPLIFHFRQRSLAPIQTPLETRMRYIENLQANNVIWDLDISSQEQELEFYRREDRSSRLLISFHDYSKTPDESRLEALLQQMNRFSPSIVKFACHCETWDDPLRLLRFLVILRSTGRDAVVLGMGEKGVVTRCFGEQFGNSVGFFVPEQWEKSAGTAPGQLRLEEYEIIRQVLKRFDRREDGDGRE